MSYLEMEAFRDGSSEVDFMEEAGSGVALVVHDFIERYGVARHIAILCGKGNNAGDAYVAGIHLLHLEYHVQAFQVPSLEECSEMTQKNAERFLNEGGRIVEVNTVEDLDFPEQGLILDGLFGTGFNGEVKEPYLSVIQAANESGLMIIAIDIPSGLNGETGIVSPVAINATETAYLGLPKTGFFLNEGWDHVGSLHYIDFGLPQEYIEEIEADLILLTPEILIPMLPKIKRTRHKYEAGLAVGLAGSPGMPGAALLASTACLRGGAGIVKLLHPAALLHELGSVPLELIKIPYQAKQKETILSHLNAASACFIGPGIGLAEETRELLRTLLLNIKKPCVLDADALNIIADENLAFPQNTVVTPHKGEMFRLLGLPHDSKTHEHKTNMDFLRLCQSWVEENGVTLVLKRAPTFILHPNEPIHVNCTGDPGMATAGVRRCLNRSDRRALGAKFNPF